VLFGNLNGKTYTNIHSAGTVFYFSPQLLSETLNLQRTCFIFFCNLCPKHSFYRERVYFPLQLTSETFFLQGTRFIFPLQLLSETFTVKGTCFIFLHNFCPKHSFYRERVLFFLQLMSAVLFTTVHIQRITLRIRPENHVGPRAVPVLLPDTN
jgi:hypothetical protein